MKKYFKLFIIIFSLFIFNMYTKAYELESEISCEYTSAVSNTGYIIYGYKYNDSGASGINYWYKHTEFCDTSLSSSAVKTENVTSINYSYGLTVFDKQTNKCTSQTALVSFTFDNILYDAYDQYVKYYNENEEYYKKNGKYKYNNFKASQFCPLTSAVKSGDNYTIKFTDKNFIPTLSSGSSTDSSSEYVFNAGSIDGYSLNLIFTKKNGSYSVKSNIKKGSNSFNSSEVGVRLNNTGSINLSVSTSGLSANTRYTILIQSANLNKLINSIENGNYKSLSMTVCQNSSLNYYIVSSTSEEICRGGIDTEHEQHEDPPEYDDSNEGNIEEPIPEGEIKDINFCSQPGILKAFQIVGYVLFVLKILVPLVLIGLGMVDFAKAAVSSDDKANKEALNTLIRRLIIGAVIFFIPTIINFVLLMVDDQIVNTVGKNSNFINCTNCLFDPAGKCANARLEQNNSPTTGGQSGGQFGGRK